jgi:hypothetical protein
MGRLKSKASREQLRGHRVRAVIGGSTVDSTLTDSAGRFSLEWNEGGERRGVRVELMSDDGNVSETTELSAEDVVSPPVLGFAGTAVIGERRKEERIDDRRSFEADDDHPICVTSSCIPVTLAWRTAPGSRVSLLADGVAMKERLPDAGSFTVRTEGSVHYILRSWESGSSDKDFTDRELEVRRYPSLSLVMEDTSYRGGAIVEFGVALCCPAPAGGLEVAVRTSDAEMVPEMRFTIPPGASWGSTKTAVGEKMGRAKVLATAAGYVSDGVTFIIE